MASITQPIEPANSNDITLRPKKSGAINLESSILKIPLESEVIFKTAAGQEVPFAPSSLFSALQSAELLSDIKSDFSRSVTKDMDICSFILRPTCKDGEKILNFNCWYSGFLDSYTEYQYFKDSQNCTVRVKLKEAVAQECELLAEKISGVYSCIHLETKDQISNIPQSSSFTEKTTEKKEEEETNGFSLDSSKDIMLVSLLVALLVMSIFSFVEFRNKIK